MSSTCDHRSSAHGFHTGDIVTASDWGGNDLRFKQMFVRGKVVKIDENFVYVQVLIERGAILKVGYVYNWYPSRVRVIKAEPSCMSSISNLFNE